MPYVMNIWLASGIGHESTFTHQDYFVGIHVSLCDASVWWMLSILMQTIYNRSKDSCIGDNNIFTSKI